MTNGQYLIEVQSLDGKGRGTVITQQVSVEGQYQKAGAGQVTARPSVVKGGAAGMWLHANSFLGLTLEARLYTVATATKWK